MNDSPKPPYSILLVTLFAYVLIGPQIATQFVRFLGDFIAASVVLGDEDYYDDLVSQINRRANVHLHDPVPMEAIPTTLNAFDVGIYLLPPVNFNHVHALPNKLFEFIQARLAVVIGPSPEMAKVVKETGCGTVATEFSAMSLASAVRELTPEKVERYKQQSHHAASVLSAESNKSQFLQLLPVPVEGKGAPFPLV